MLPPPAGDILQSFDCTKTKCLSIITNRGMIIIPRWRGSDIQFERIFKRGWTEKIQIDSDTFFYVLSFACAKERTKEKHTGNDLQPLPAP